MSEPDLAVYTDMRGKTHLSGFLWIHENRQGIPVSTFRYADSWLNLKSSFAIDPLLPLSTPGPFNKKGLPGAIADSAPDRWGRVLMARGEGLRATQEGRTPRHLREIDYLLGVSDFIRQGALRFAFKEGGTFLTPPDKSDVPLLVGLPKLLASAQGFIADPDSEEDLKILLAPGSSLGGARPKASVIDGKGRLSIAKFPKSDDLFSVGAWEHLALGLARDAGIRTADSELLSIDGQDVILLPRFDRKGAERIPFLSAMSMLNAVDRETRSYLEIADVLRRFGTDTRGDLRELWRRIAFNVLVSNTDDHLRNHGFLYTAADSWTLSPAYDINPVSTQIKPRFLSTAIGENPDDTSASLSLAIEVAEYFDMEEEEARAVSREVAEVTRQWADRATDLRIAGSEIKFMASAFEHEDLTLALGS